jgi:hypothetical protein
MSKFTLPVDNNAPRPTKVLAAELTLWARSRGTRVDAASGLRAVLAWSRLHGFIGLEIAGNYKSMGLNPDGLFEAELSRL